MIKPFKSISLQLSLTIRMCARDPSRIGLSENSLGHAGLCDHLSQRLQSLLSDAKEFEEHSSSYFAGLRTLQWEGINDLVSGKQNVQKNIIVLEMIEFHITLQSFQI